MNMRMQAKRLEGRRLLPQRGERQYRDEPFAPEITWPKQRSDQPEPRRVQMKHGPEPKIPAILVQGNSAVLDPLVAEPVVPVEIPAGTDRHQEQAQEDAPELWASDEAFCSR